MSDDLRHRLGTAGEDHAAAHLERLGYEIVARNHRTREGELDLVARDATTLVFAEVKTRRSGPGAAWVLEKLDRRKQLRVRRMALDWLAQAPAGRHAPDVRFDAIAVILDGRGRLVSLDHLEGAF